MGAPWHQTTVLESIWRRVDVKDTILECWPWKEGHTISNGYAKIIINGKQTQVSRVLLEHMVGPLGELQACHRCDLRRCCNPTHLWPGTNEQNRIDMWTKNRQNTAGLHLPPEGFCRNGHPKPEGARRCNVCARKQGREYMRRKRAK